jgi:hypothetical protein
MAKSQSIITSSGRLRLTFNWFEDRFSHQVEWCDGDRDIVLLKSLEGNPDESWPLSPPFQQVEPHSIGDGTKSLLAIGLAGTSHWSASVEQVGKDRLENESRIRIDVACRMKSRAPMLGSTYDYFEGASLQSTDRGLLLKSVPDVALQVATSGQITQSGRSLTIAPLQIPAENPATARWVYDFVVNGNS